MLQINIPDNLTNKAVRKLLLTLSRTVVQNYNPVDFTCVEEPGGGMRLNTTFDTISGEHYHLKLELKPV